MKHLFIINPVAGKGKAVQVVEKIKNIFMSLDEPFFIEYTRGPGHATEIVKQYVEKDKFRVYSVGGDGTLNEVLNGIVNSGSSLAVIPSGTGNDFIKSLCTIKDFNEILYRTIKGEEKYIDLARVNGRYFLNISSMGIDADVAYNVERFKKLPFIKGIVAYLISIFYSLIKFKSHNLKILIDEKEFELKSILLAVANGRYYGGGMMPAPDAKIDDGLFDICVVKHMSKLKILGVFPKIIKGAHGGIKEVSFHRGKKIHIISDSDIQLNVDGEVCTVREGVFDIIPKGIEIVIPK